jgi:protein involved in polysaccharide export with SLBB domain
MKKIIILTLVMVGVCSYVYADDGGLSGLSGLSPSGASTTTPSDSGGVVVPPIVGAGNVPSSNKVNDNSGLMSNSVSEDASIVAVDDGNGDGETSEDSDTPNVVNSNTGKKVKVSKYGDPFINEVYIRTGVRLSKYGTDGGLGSLGSYSQTKSIPVPANYIIVPGDVISAQSWGAVNTKLSLTVKPDGTVFIPKVGEVSVAGVKAGQLNNYMAEKLGKIYRNFSLTSNVAKIQSIPIVVTGMAANPGVQLISSLSTLSSAIGKVGGPSALGSLRDVELIRNGQVVENFDIYDLLMDGRSNHDVELEANDVIKFKPLGPEVAIYDGVKRPAIYEIKSGERIEDLIRFAGGYTSDAKTNKIIVETVAKNQAIKVNDYETSEALYHPLSGGMIIHFFKSYVKYESSVAVIGNVTHPSRYGYFEGMRVSDVIPNKEALLTQSYYNSVSFNTVGRDNALTQQGIEKTTGSGASGINLTTGLQSSQNLSNNDNVFGGGQNLFTAGPISIPEANINWNYAVIVRTNPENYSTSLIPFNLRKAIAKDGANDLELQPGDVVNVLSAKDARGSTAGGSIYVFIDGEVISPGVYELKDGQTLQDVIESAGGVSNKAYLFGMELTRQSVKKQQSIALNQMLDQAQQNLLAQAGIAASSNVNDSQGKSQALAVQQQLAFINKMRQIQPSGRIVLNMGNGNATLKNVPNFKLDNGDAVYIPPRPDVINVVGQVYNPATFIYQPSYTVRKYIDLAGAENNYADTSSEYVLRADGSLYNKQQAGWFGGFDGKTLNPGDVVIVPQEVQVGNMVQNIMNWTQILANSAQAVVLFTGTK